jgi:hypothetical protein
LGWVFLAQQMARDARNVVYAIETLRSEFEIFRGVLSGTGSEILARELEGVGPKGEPAPCQKLLREKTSCPRWLVVVGMGFPGAADAIETLRSEFEIFRGVLSGTGSEILARELEGVGLAIAHPHVI